MINDSGEVRIFINENDLWAYGPVVLTQELLHAAIKRGRYTGVLKGWHYKRFASVNERFFSHFDGYVGLVNPRGNGHLAPNEASLLYGAGYAAEKAFAVGYTYTLLKRHYNDFAEGERAEADRYFSDVESNIQIAEISIDVEAPFIPNDDSDTDWLGARNHTGPLFLLGSNVASRDIDYFIDQFIRSTSEVRTYLAPALERF